MAFDQSTRNRLSRFVADARTLLTAEFTRQLQNDYGMDPASGELTPLDRLGHLEDARRETARILRDTLTHYLVGNAKPNARTRRDVLERIVREQAFTVLNRLCALRMMEARDLLVESIARGYGSRGFQLYDRLAGTALGDTGDAYRTYLFSLFDEFALDLAVLFDRHSPQGRLFPSQATLEQLLDLINDHEIEPLWAEDETIGWIYQYFNSKEERKAMRDASQAPRNSRELAVRNQFFTPRYVVEFLTDNTLGRIWYEMTKCETRLVDQCRYLVRRPTEIFLTAGEEAPDEPESDADLSQEELLKQPVYIPHRPVKDPRQITMLDPACGSMHFGLYAFGLYEAIYNEAWELEERFGSQALLRTDGLQSLHESYPDRETFLRDVPRLIMEHNIHGIDIDPRAVQIAGLSLWLRAQRSWQQQGIKAQERPVIRKSNIVCAEPMPGDNAQLDEFLKGLREERLETLIRKVLDVPENQRIRATPTMADALCELVTTVWHEMELAGEAGSLLKIEESLAAAIDHARDEWEQRLPLFRVETFRMTETGEQEAKVTYPRMVPGEEADFWDRAEALVLAALEEYAEQAQQVDGYARRLFAADAARGFAFTDLRRFQYDVVLMNPPFGETVSGSRNYLRSKYPNAISDIGMVFVDSYSAKLANLGFLGAITNRTCLATSQLEAWRRHTLLGQAPLFALADLGYGVLDDAMVEACVYVVEKTNLSSFAGFRLLESQAKDRDLLQLVNKWSRAESDPRSQTGTHLSFSSLPLAVISYWAPQLMLSKLLLSHQLDSAGPGANDGGHTGDDFRFLRTTWEVPSFKIGLGLSFVFFAKGGEYSPVWDDIYLVENWRSNGREVRQIPGARIYHEDLHFKAGLTYPLRTTSDFSPRILPRDTMFSTGGHGIHFDHPDDVLSFLGLYYTRIGKIFVEILFGGGDASVSGSAARNYTAGTINMLPLPELEEDKKLEVNQLVRSLISAFRSYPRDDETTRFFQGLDFAKQGCSIRQGLQISLASSIKWMSAISFAMQRLEDISYTAFGLDKNDVSEVLNLVYGLHPCSYNQSEVSSLLPSLLDCSLSQLIQTAAESTGGRNRSVTKKSFFIDRHIDLISHILSCNPASILDAWNESLYLPAEMVTEASKKIMQYLVGSVLGRWNIQLSVDAGYVANLPDPFDPVPVCSPAMLKNQSGLPATHADISEDYPLRISWPGILVDDAGHPEDIVARIREALAVIWPDTHEAIEAEACEILGVNLLRAYFANPNQFFANHLSRYYKSRRYAPIYWPLSTPSGSYTLWLYYHRLSDQILYTCVNDFVDPKLNEVSGQVADLRRKVDRTRSDEQELEQLSDFELELQEFRTELLRIAQFWQPNLNDGVQITAAPLWRLFQHRQWQNRLQDTWEKLEAGEYEWAHLAMSIWPARVVPKCVDDRSLAIAHDVEELFWVEDADGNWRKLGAPAVEIEGQKKRLHKNLSDKLRERMLKALTHLAENEGHSMVCTQVAQYLAEGDWDDTEAALLFWPERVAEKCIADPFWAARLGISFPSKPTKTALKRWTNQLIEAGCPDWADALLASLNDEDIALEQFVSELKAGRRDHAPLALPLFPDRIVDKCVLDVELAEIHGLRRLFWVQHPGEAWRRRGDPRREVADEVARRT